MACHFDSACEGCIADTNLFREHYPVFRPEAQWIFPETCRSECWFWTNYVIESYNTIQPGQRSLQSDGKDPFWQVFVPHLTKRGHQRVPKEFLIGDQEMLFFWLTMFSGTWVKKKLEKDWQNVCLIQLMLNQAVRQGSLVIPDVKIKSCSQPMAFFCLLTAEYKRCYENFSQPGVYFSWGGEPCPYFMVILFWNGVCIMIASGALISLLSLRKVRNWRSRWRWCSRERWRQQWQILAVTHNHQLSLEKATE